MSSASRWAPCVRFYHLPTTETEIGVSDCRNVVPGFFGVDAGAGDLEFAFEQGLTIPGWFETPDQPMLPSVFGLRCQTCARTRIFLHVATYTDVLAESWRDNNSYALSLHLQAAPATMVKLRGCSQVRCCRDMTSSRVALSVAMGSASTHLALPLCSRAHALVPSSTGNILEDS